MCYVSALGIAFKHFVWHTTYRNLHNFDRVQEAKKAEEATKAEEIKAAELEEASGVNVDILPSATAVRDDGVQGCWLYIRQFFVDGHLFYLFAVHFLHAAAARHPSPPLMRRAMLPLS